MKTYFQWKTEKITDIYGLLGAIQTCPVMFIGRHSLSLLRAYLHGIKVATEIFKKPFEWRKFYASDWRKSNFTTYVAKKFEQPVGTKDWCHLILESMNFDEEKAIDLFFIFLEEFKLEKEGLEKRIVFIES